MKAPFEPAFSETFEMSSLARKAPSNRILADVQCKVCHDLSSGKHYGIFSCDGCAGFFKRSIRKPRSFVCKARGSSINSCPMDKAHRNQCRACRLRKCLEAGMNKDAVQHERGPRNATKQRQAAMMFKESWNSPTSMQYPAPALHHHHPPDLARLFNSASSFYNSALIAASMPAHAAYMRPAPTIFHPMPKYPHFPMQCSPTESVSELATRIGKCTTETAPELASRLGKCVSEPVPELAARIVFHTVNWLKTIPGFVGLPMKDQLLLLKEGWQELFLLTAVEYDLSMDKDSLTEAAGISSEPADSEKRLELSKSIESLHNLSSQIKQMQLDWLEFYYLKLTFLFKTDTPDAPPRIKDLIDHRSIAAHHDRAQLTLMSHSNTRHPTQQLRCLKLQKLQPALLAVSGDHIARIFFQTIRDRTTMEKVFCDLLANGSGLSWSFGGMTMPSVHHARSSPVHHARSSPFEPPAVKQ